MKQVFATAIAIVGLSGCAVDEQLDERASAASEAPCTPGRLIAGPSGNQYGIVTIPVECTNIEVKVWGDGGGNGYLHQTTGGGGGYAHVQLLNDHPSDHKLRFDIGRNGWPEEGGGWSGGGGYVQWMSDAGAYDEMIAIAGGGGAGGGSTVAGATIGRGGAGGGQAGEGSRAFWQHPSLPQLSATLRPGPGGGGSDTEAGSGGIGDCFGWAVAIRNGEKGGASLPAGGNNGGSGGIYAGSGGRGGGGRYGGGGGAVCAVDDLATVWASTGGAGGGGGNYADGGGATALLLETAAGNWRVPGNVNDPDRCDADAAHCMTAYGAAAPKTPRVAGRVVIRWW